MGECECGRLKGNPCGPLRPNPFNVTMLSGKTKVEKKPSGSENVVTLTARELQSHLWEAANILRGSAVDRTDWKGYILPLLFFKSEGKGKPAAGPTREVVPDPHPAVESISWKQDEIKISIWDCRRAIEIAGGIPLTIRGALFVGLGPDPVATGSLKRCSSPNSKSKRVDGASGISVLRATGRNTSPSWRETSLRTTSAHIPCNNRTPTPRSPWKRQSASTMAPASKHSGWKRCNGCLRNASGRPLEAVRGL